MPDNQPRSGSLPSWIISATMKCAPLSSLASQAQPLRRLIFESPTAHFLSVKFESSVRTSRIRWITNFRTSEDFQCTPNSAPSRALQWNNPLTGTHWLWAGLAKKSQRPGWVFKCNEFIWTQIANYNLKRKAPYELIGNGPGAYSTPILW